MYARNLVGSMLGFLFLSVLGIGMMSMPLFEEEPDDTDARPDDDEHDGNEGWIEPDAEGPSDADGPPGDTTGDADPSPPSEPSSKDENPDREVRHIRGITPQTATEAREVFALKSFPGDRPELAITLRDFDPTDDRLAYSLADLAEAANATLLDVDRYEVSSFLTTDGLSTEVRISLFLKDAPDTAASVQTALLTGVMDFDAAEAVSVVSTFHGLESIDGGERAALTTKTDLVSVTAAVGDDQVVATGSGVDSVTVAGDRALVETGAGADIIAVTGNHGAVDGGAGTDVITVVGSGTTVDGGDGADIITADAGNTVSGGPGADVVTVLLGDVLTDQPPLLGWNPTDTGNGATLVTLDDAADAVELTFGTGLPGTFHRLDVTDFEYVGGGRSEASCYSLVIWTPDARADLGALIDDFQSYAHATDDPMIDAAAIDSNAARVLATIKTGSLVYDSENPENSRDTRVALTLDTSLPLVSTAATRIFS